MIHPADPHSTIPTRKSTDGQEDIKALEPLRKRFFGRRMVFVSGNFNIVHPGHLRLLNFARECGDGLVVGLYSDESPGVIVSYEDRKATLMGLEAVTEVIEIQPEGLPETIRFLKPHTIVKGKEHELLQNVEQLVATEYGGHLIFSAGDQRFSSRDLLRKEMVWERGTVGLRADGPFLRDHALSVAQMVDRVNSFAGARVLVIGDLIVDEYIYCEPVGMSQEDPTVVVTPIESKRFIGAAGIVAAHLSGLGAQTRYFSIVGDDETGREAGKLLGDYGVDPFLVFDASRPTTLKQRFRAQGKTLLRVSHLKSHDAGQEYLHLLLSKIKSAIPDTDVVIFSDFNYGCLPQNLVDSVCSLCKKHKVPYVADSQASSQVADVGRFIGADFLSATEREARLAVNDFRSGLQNIANILFDRCQVHGLIVKLGAEGLILLSRGDGHATASLMALNPHPVDVAGAGDAFLAAATLARTAGADLPEAAYIGSVAAGVQVSRTGNLPLGKKELIFGIEASKNFPIP